MTTVRHEEPSAVGFTQASSVIPDTRSIEFASATETMSFAPSKVSAEPKRPSAVRVAPATVPPLPRPEASNAVVPDGSSKPHAPTRPGSTGHTASAYVAVYVAAVLGAVNWCAAAPPSDHDSKS
jgi:hypothetical protein